MKCSDLETLFKPFPDVMTPKEISIAIRASESHIYRLIVQERLPCFCVGRHYRIMKQDMIRCLENEVAGKIQNHLFL